MVSRSSSDQLAETERELVAVPVPPSPEQTFIQVLNATLHELESRISALEFDNERLKSALKKAGEFVFDSPMSKVFLMGMPKEMQTKLKEFFNASR
jgi:hypothetical protein